MGFFSNLFKKQQSKTPEPKEYKKAISFLEEFEVLLKQNRFLARSDYKHLIEEYKSTFVFFNNAQTANTLSYYCKTNKLDHSKILKFIIEYTDIQDVFAGSAIIKTHNNDFINKALFEEKKYLDKILIEIDPNILLDEDQRKVVLSDEDYTLVVAGAGAGKTTTVAAKVRYLVEKKKIDPKQILIISFTNKAVGELKERINDQLNIPCPITTFHSAGYAILRKQEDSKKIIVDEGYLYSVLNKYLKEQILSKPENVDKLVMFFGSYFDAPYEGEDINQFFNYVTKADFSTIKSNVEEYNTEIIDRRTGKLISINNEYLRSAQEVQIANFLYLNQIDYTYEEIYPYHILKAKKPYTPDFCIRQNGKVAYIEHFGISESGESNYYTEKQLETYKQAIRDKVDLHKRHKTNLLFTFSKYNDGRDLISHLREKLERNGFVLRPRNSTEVFNKLVNSEESKYITKLTKLLCVFINNFKTNGFTEEDFYRFEKRNPNVRTKLFLDICKDCYLEYQKSLSENNAIDFQDMINFSAEVLRKKQVTNEKLDFKYVIVDEYQDISHQRFDLTKELSKVCNAKIIAVGDDWQSIYAFSGSDVSLFTRFKQIMGYADELKIIKTYRNAQEVIDIAGGFVQKNENQIKKTLISPKHIDKPIKILTYSEEYDKKEASFKGGKYLHLGKKVEDAITDILKSSANKTTRILLIGRYGFDAKNLCFSKDFVYDEKNKKIFSKKFKDINLEFLTAHSSKGLGYDNVIIINSRNEMYGFPSKLEVDPVMKYVIKEDYSIDYAEERRLFYVALTRTKNRVYIIAPEQRPSEFTLELIRDYSNVEVIGEINTEPTGKITKKLCPICGFPLQLRGKKSYGMKLWMCSNEPEICNYLTNDIAGGELSVQKCDKCQDGYLVVKPGAKDFILGCTNYKKDGSGCDRIISKDLYKKWKNDGWEEDSSFDKPSFTQTEDKHIPNIVHTTKKPIESQRKKAQVNLTEYKTHFIEKDGFNVVCDNENNIITDMRLLYVLRTLRSDLSKEKNVKPYMILKNDGLVSLATFKPLTKEEFITLHGLGEVTYNNFGEVFIKKIKDYLTKNE